MAQQTPVRGPVSAAASGQEAPTVEARHAIVGGVALPPQITSVVLDWKLQGIHAWYYLAQDKGYFSQEKIDIIKTRMMKYFGYNEVSARDVLDYVASIYARGDAK